MSWLPHVPTTSEADATENFEAIVATIFKGRGTPENRVGAPVGSLYIREDGGKGSTLYVKEHATAPTDMNGWEAK
jgi:hypothetical protein